MHSYFGWMRTGIILFIEAAHMKINNSPYYPHALIQGFAYAHTTLFEIPSVMHLRANYLAFMYLGKQYRLY